MIVRAPRLLLIGLCALLPACQDAILPSIEDGRSAQASYGRAAAPPALPAGEIYSCLVSTATPEGPYAYRYSRVELDFPGKVRHPSAATHRYRYRAEDADGAVLRVVNCTIPRTPSAVAMMNRYLRVPPQIPARGRTGDGEVVNVQVCDPECTLDPIVVIGDPDTCDPWMSLDWCAGGGDCLESLDPDAIGVLGCWDGGGGGGGSDPGWGGFDPDPGDPYSWDDGTGRPPCERDAKGWCITRVVNSDEWQRLGQRIEAIRENPVECKGAKDALRGLYAEGRESQRLRFWDGYDMDGPDQQRYGQNLTDTQGRFIEFDSYHVFAMPTLVVHEGLHLYYSQNPHPTLIGKDLHALIFSIEGSCV